MRKTRAVSLTALIAGASMVLAACGGSVGGDTTTSAATSGGGGSSATGEAPDSSEATGESEATSGAETSEGGSGEAGGTINVGLEQTPGGYNCNTAASNSVYCAYVDNLTQGAFVRVQPDGSLKPDTTFGTYEKVSDDPLTVEYTFADDAVWSDGTPIDYDDALLAWAGYSGTHPGEADADGNTLDLFQAASTNGWSLVEMPQGKAGDKKFTMTFTTPYADWEVLGAGFMPAHIAAEQAGLSSDDNGAELVAAIQENDATKLKAVGDFWSLGWDYEVDLPTLPDTALLPSSGPYKYDNASNGNLTLVKNDAFWGEPGKADSFVFKLVSAEEWVQAMTNGEIDAFDPSNPTEDVLLQLQAQPDTIQYEVGDSYSFSHVDFDSSPTGRLADIKVRQALLKCIPREELVEKYAKPINPDAQVLNLREFLPAQGNYEEILAQVPSAALYDSVDLPGAQALLAEAGVTTPYDLRFIFAATSGLRADQVQVIKASCDQAGFNIIAQPDEDVFTTLASAPGTWDMAVFGWSGSGLVASGESIYVTGGDQNFGKYSDPIVDEVWADVVSTVDRDAAEEKKVALEEQLWANPYNAVLYSTPGLAAFSTSINGAAFNPTQTGITWNAATWTKSS